MYDAIVRSAFLGQRPCQHDRRQSRLSQILKRPGVSALTRRPWFLNPNSFDRITLHAVRMRSDTWVLKIRCGDQLRHTWSLHRRCHSILGPKISTFGESIVAVYDKPRLGVIWYVCYWYIDQQSPDL